MSSLILKQFFNTKSLIVYVIYVLLGLYLYQFKTRKHFWIWIIDIVTTTTAFTCFITKMKKYRLISVNIYYF